MGEGIRVKHTGRKEFPTEAMKQERIQRKPDFPPHVPVHCSQQSIRNNQRPETQCRLSTSKPGLRLLRVPNSRKQIT